MVAAELEHTQTNNQVILLSALLEDSPFINTSTLASGLHSSGFHHPGHFTQPHRKPKSFPGTWRVSVTFWPTEHQLIYAVACSSPRQPQSCTLTSCPQIQQVSSSLKVQETPRKPNSFSRSNYAANQFSEAPRSPETKPDLPNSAPPLAFCLNNSSPPAGTLSVH